MTLIHIPSTIYRLDISTIVWQVFWMFWYFFVVRIMKIHPRKNHHIVTSSHILPILCTFRETTKRNTPMPNKTATKKIINNKETQHSISYRIHGTGIFTYIYHKNQPNVGEYASHMDPSWVSQVKSTICEQTSSHHWRSRNTTNLQRVPKKWQPPHPCRSMHTPSAHPPANANYEKNPFVACW